MASLGLVVERLTKWLFYTLRMDRCSLLHRHGLLHVRGTAGSLCSTHAAHWMSSLAARRRPTVHYSVRSHTTSSQRAQAAVSVRPGLNRPWGRCPVVHSPGNTSPVAGWPVVNICVSTHNFMYSTKFFFFFCKTVTFRFEDLTKEDKEIVLQENEFVKSHKRHIL